MIALLLALTFGANDSTSHMWIKRDPSSEFQMPKAYAVAKPSGEIIIYTQKHGEINLDTLLNRIDSILDGKARKTERPAILWRDPSGHLRHVDPWCHGGNGNDGYPKDVTLHDLITQWNCAPIEGVSNAATCESVMGCR